MYDNSDELMHYGRKGMKWYQNIFTAGKNAGSGTRKKTTAVKTDKEKAKAAREKEKQNRKTVDDAQKKPAKYKSTDELRKAIEHMRLEQDYNRLVAENTKVSGGKAWCKKFGSEALSPAVITAGRNVLTKAFEKLGNKVLGLEGAKEVRDELDDLKREAQEWKYKEQIEKSKRYLDGNNKAVKNTTYYDPTAKNKAAQEDWVKRQREAEDHDLRNKAEQARRQTEARNRSDKIDRNETVNEGRSFIRSLTGGFDSKPSSSSEPRRLDQGFIIVGEPTPSSKPRWSNNDIIIDADFKPSESNRSAGRSYVSGWLSGSSQLLLPGA